MATKADFTEQEWDALHKGVTGAGFLMAVSDRSFFDSFKEAGALARHMTQARQTGESELIRELATTSRTGFHITDSPSEIERETTDALATATEALKAKAPEELPAYRAFVLEIAESVGNAAGGGETAEAATLERIRVALNGS
jgi:predicted RNA-binding Zn ribbon-like protein